MPIYKTTAVLAKNAQTIDVVQLVEAPNLNAAVRHVARGIINAEACSTAEAIDLGSRGVKLERAGE